MPKKDQQANDKYTTSQFNTRLPRLTHEQINDLSHEYGLTKTQVIILAVDRLTRDLKSESGEASREVRMLQTVTRVAPQHAPGLGDQEI